VSVSPSIDWEKIAELTEGFSGADLQAIVYNAHLEVVHSSIAANPGLERTTTSEGKPIEYVVLGGPEGKSIVSRAEESALQRRVSYFI
jgi:peroxin-1